MGDDLKEAMQGRLVGFFGYKRAGKDTVVKMMEEHCVYIRNMKFATPLKEMAKSFITLTTDLPPDIVYGGQQRDAHSEDIYYITGGKMTTVRQLLQWLGTECGRALDEGLWVRAMKRRLEMATSDADYICITDCRFRNEMDLIKDLGGRCVLVDRPGLKGDGHASEVIPASPEEFDWVLDNSGGLWRLEEQVEKMMKEWGHE